MGAKLRRALPWLVALAVAAGVIGLYLRPQPVPVEVAVVDEGPVLRVVRGDGHTRLPVRARLLAPASGILARIPFDPGDLVEPGTTLVRIDPDVPPPLDARTRRRAEARLRAAEAELEAARAEAEAVRVRLDHARTELARIARLVERRIQPESELDRARAEARRLEAELAAARARVAAAQAEVDLARAELSAFEDASRVLTDAPAAGNHGCGGCIRVRAATRWLVLRVLRRDSGPIARGEPLLELARPGVPEIVVDLPTAEALRLAPGAPARVEPAPGLVLPARVRRIEPGGYVDVSPLGIEERRTDVVLELLAEPPAGLGDGYAVDVRIEAARLERAVRVPLEALVRSGGAWAVRVVQEGRAQLRHVEPVLFGERSVAIRAGVEPGDHVILTPGEDLADGTPVAPRPVQPRTRGEEGA